MTVRPSKKMAAALITLALVLSGCGGGDDGGSAKPPATERPAQVDRLRLSGFDIGYPSPFAYLKGPGLVQVNFVFDTLIWKDDTGKFVPLLASAWEHSANGTEWRFTLRDGATWHDGRPVTADDVVFTFQYMTTGPGKDALGFIGKPEVTEVVAEAPNRVLIHLPGPSALFEPTVAGRVPIIPKHIWSGVTDPAKYLDRTAVIGSGPYRLESYDRAAGSYLYTANDSYFLGKPYVRRLEFVPAPNALQALGAGGIDAATVGVENLEEAIPDSVLKAYEGGKYGRVTAPGEANRALHFNIGAGFPYNDKRFRQAVAFGIDRQDLVKRILVGRGQPGSSGNLAPSNPFLAEGLPTYGRDLTRAKALLDEIGLKDANGDGTRDLPDGRPFTPELQTNSLFSPQTPQLIKEYLREAGIDVQIKSLDQATSDANGIEGRYGMALFTYGGMGGDPDYLRTRLSSKSQAKVYSKIHGFTNARFEELAGKQRVTIDVPAREKLVDEMQQIVAEELPLLSLYVPDRMQIFVKDVFDAWYFTPGGLFALHPGPYNKLALATGHKTGT